jgi:glyoxylase-like metal-dependent hydrolase (beta-lactamase superfamily II)
VDKIVITHNHFDHIGGAAFLKKEYNAKVYAKIKSGDLIDYTLNDNDVIKLAEREFLVIHTPGHSDDSICLYNEDEQVLFSGDTTLQIRDFTGSYTPEYIDTLNKLSKLKIKTIYPGHGNPITENPEKMIKSTIANVIKSDIVYCGNSIKH